MANEFGEYGTTGIVDVELGDDFFDAVPNTPIPNVPEGTLVFYIKSYEQKLGTNKPSFGYNFVLVPYQDEYGLPVEARMNDIEMKKYFYVGKVDKTTGKLYERAQVNNFPTFLTSIGIGKESDGMQVFSLENVRGVLVKAEIKHVRTVSTRENPNTGQIPTEIDENDPYSYVILAQISDSVRGVRDADGKVQRVNI